MSSESSKGMEEQGKLGMKDDEKQQLLRKAREYIKASAPHHLDPENNVLCGRCRKVDWDAAFKPLKDFERVFGRVVLPLKSIAQRSNTSTCPFCRLLESMSTREHKPGDLRAQDSKSTRISHNYSDYFEHPVVLGIVCGLLGLNKDARGATRELVCQVDPPSVIARRKLSLNGCLVHPTRIEYGKIRGWLEHCQNFQIHKPGLQERQVSRPISLKLIDCRSRDIVQAEPKEPYFALSYVWGNNSRNSSITKQDQSTQSLPDFGVPQVIEDAITVVKNLGSRYLWVDCLCINQNDEQERHEQITRMDQIYEGAVATLVAATGRYAASGLPGVGPVPRRLQPIAIVDDKVLISSLPHISVPLQSSAWITRGWTYQEAALSKRCLFFTEHQVYFACGRMTCQESVEISLDVRCSHTSRYLESDSWMHDILEAPKSPPPHIWQPRVQFINFLRHLIQYKSRTLSYDDDSLNAFKGILSRSPLHTLWGIPITFGLTMKSRPDSVDISFARGLWWPPSPNAADDKERQSRRRPAFPSWSWAGWACGIQDTILGDHTRDAEPNLFQDTIHFQVEQNSGELVTLDKLCRNSPSKIIQETSQTLVIEARAAKVYLQRRGFERMGRAYVCKCHPISRHEDYHTLTQRYYEVMVCESPINEDRGLFDKLWDCVVLWETQLTLYCWIVDRGPSSFELLGMVKLADDDFEHLSWERKRFHLT